jgi:aerobic carbon-monoxide dehydrogenase medium subunit
MAVPGRRGVTLPGGGDPGVKPPPFEYHAPSSVEEACELLGSLEDAKVLAGGQSLIPLLNFRLARPAHLVDINRIGGLDRVYERDGGIAVQALARQAAVEDSEVVARVCPLLTAAVRLVAHRVIRNRGTVCGSLAHADSASELPAVLLALGGKVIARSSRGDRVIAAEDLFTGVFETALAPDEMLVEAWFPASPKPSAIAEESRRHGDFALAGVVRAGAKLALFGVAATPVLADSADPTRGLKPSGDLEATPEFRLHLVRVLTEKVFAA